MPPAPLVSLLKVSLDLREPLVCPVSLVWMVLRAQLVPLVLQVLPERWSLRRAWE